jgi:hypothetical protein
MNVNVPPKATVLKETLLVVFFTSLRSLESVKRDKPPGLPANNLGVSVFQNEKIVDGL